MTSPSPATLPDVLTIRQLADYLKVHPKTAYKYVAKGDIPGFQTTGRRGRWRIQREDLESHNPRRRPASNGMTTAAAPELARKWLSVEEAAFVTGVSSTELYEALRSHELPGSQRRKNTKWRIHVDDLDTWMRGNRT